MVGESRIFFSYGTKTLINLEQEMLNIWTILGAVILESYTQFVATLELIKTLALEPPLDETL